MLVFVLNQAQKANTGKIQTPVYENVREFGFLRGQALSHNGRGECRKSSNTFIAIFSSPRFLPSIWCARRVVFRRPERRSE